MKYLGVDFGENKIGLAISDINGKIAFSFKILPNDKNIKDEFLKILEEENIQKIIFGKSLDYDMKENQIHKKLEKFILKIKDNLEEINIDWDFENEVFTSMEARRGQIKNERRVRKNERIQKKINQKKNIDDSAAALILKTYLNK